MMITGFSLLAVVGLLVPTTYGDEPNVIRLRLSVPTSERLNSMMASTNCSFIAMSRSLA